MNPPDTETLVEAYFEHADWEAEQERAANTSDAVRELLVALLDRHGPIRDEEIGSEELTALYNLAQHQNIYGREKKRKAVDQFDIGSEAREAIYDCIDGRIGIVGKGTYAVDVNGDEETVTNFLDEFIHAASAEDRYDVVEEFAARGISGVQAGIFSTLAHVLFPEEYPIANKPAREGLADYFGYEVSDQLSDYPDTVQTFRTVRKENAFAENFRCLDYFFQWATANPTGNPDDPKVSDVTNKRADVYWVNQTNREELNGYYLRALDDDHHTHRVDRLTEGDLVFHNLGGKLHAVSRATGEIQATRDGGEEYEIAYVETCRLKSPATTDEVAAALDYDPFRPDKYYPVDSNGGLNQGYLFELSNQAADWLLTELEIENPEWVGPPSWGVDADQTDSSSVPNTPPARHEEIARQLDTTGQVVLSGPPGTGKTHTATEFAQWWVGEHTDGAPDAEQVRTVTFHPAFAYEDFLEGLTAKTTDDGEGVVYEEEPGILQTVANDAREAAAAADGDAPPYVLVVDEINRGDLPQILGEAITLLEPGEREAHEIELAHSGDSFSLPSNLYLIGTMNTADQSIALVDAALRRRFRFLQFPPAPERVAELELARDGLSGARDVLGDEAASKHDRLVAASALALSTLNERIRTEASRLERGQQLGHTALLGHDDPQGVVDAWQFQLLPQLSEYYYGQTESLQRELFDDSDNDLFDWERGTVADFDAQTLYDALCALTDDDAAEFDAEASEEADVEASEEAEPQGTTASDE